MANVLLSNSYQILGLENTAKQRDILKRSKDIVKLLAIDQSPRESLNLGTFYGLFDDFRTESKVKEAAQNLSIPKKRIKEYFFAFDVRDSTDGRAISLVQELNFSEARDVWKDAAEKDSPKALFYKKNLALLDLWILYEKDTQYALKESIALLKELVKSEDFWEAYSKVYKSNDDLSSDQEVIDDFKKQVPALLSDIYTDLGKKNNSNSYLNEFVKTFGGKGEQLDKTVITPIYQKINNALDKLNAIEIKSGEILSQAELNKIKESIKEVQDGFNEIIEVGLYDDSQTKVLRDKAASTIRRIALDFNNNIFEYKTALGFINIADSIAGTALLKDKIKVDLETIESNVADLDLTDVTDLIQKQKFKEAMDLIDEKLENSELSRITKNRLEQIKNAYTERLKTLGKPISKAPPLFTVWGFGTYIYGDTLFLTALFIPILPLARYTLQAQGNGRYSFYGRLPLTTKQRWWFWIGLIIGIIWLFSALGNSGNSSTASSATSNTSSANDTVQEGQYHCSRSDDVQASALKPLVSEKSNLDTELSTLTALKNRINSTYVDNYDQDSVNSYNALVDQFNRNRVTYNSDLTAYNNKVDAYNNFLAAHCSK